MIPLAKTRSAGLLLLACSLACFWTSPISAQVLTGSIGGTVTDASGAVLIDVKVTTTSPALIGGSKTQQSDQNGVYNFLELQPGTYAVRFEKQGFKTFTQQNVVINTGVRVTVNAKMDLGEVTQEVTVEAEAATIDTEHVTSQTVANQAVMEDIPNGRSPWAIANSVPSIASATPDVGGSSGMQQSALISHGSTAADEKFMIDGISVNWTGGSGGATLMYYDMGMFQEVNYLSGALPADVGQGGVYMNMITKDGGNEFHGRIFANGAPESWQSNNISPTLNTQLLNNLSATTRSLINLATVVPGTPITEVYDVNGQFGGPIIKNKLWFFTSFRQWATNNIVSGAFNANGTQALNPNQIDDEMAKFSYQANDKNRFSLLYFRNQKNRYDRRNQGSFGDDVTTVLQNQLAYEADFKWTYVPTNRWVIDAGFALTAGKTPYRYQALAPAGALSVYDTSTAEVYNIAEYTYINPDYRGALDASASYFTSNWGGSHNIKFGTQIYKDGFQQRYTANGDLQGEVQNGVPYQALLYNTPINIQKNNLLTSAIFAEDNWKIKRLNINYGLRWEDWDGTIPAQSSPAGTYVAARNYAQIDGPNWKNFTPRFGFSYDLTGKGKTVIKGSVSEYLQGEGAGNLLTAINPLGFSTEVVPWTCGGTGQTAANLACIAAGPQPNQLNLAAANGFTGGLTTKLGPNLQRPRSWEYNLGIQQELPYGVIFSVMAWYRKTTDQIGTENVAVPSSAYTPYTLRNPLTGGSFTFYNEQAAFKGLQQNELVNSPELNLYYRGIDFDLNKRLSHRFLLVGGVTYGRFSGAWTGDVNNTLLDLNNPNYNLNRDGATQQDAPIIFKMGGTFELPYKVMLAGNFQHVTGYPIEATYPVTSAILTAETGASLIQGTQNVYMAESGSYREPDLNLLDMRLSRVFSIKERYKLEPEFDIYNLTNAGTVVSANGTVTAGTALAGLGSQGSLFLNPTNVLPPRLYKIGLRFDF